MKTAKIILAIIGIAIVLISILFCLPKKIDFLLGDAEITSFSCIAIQDVFDTETATAKHDVWKASYDTATEETTAQLADILSSSRYRPMLKTFQKPSTFELNGDYSVDLILVMSDGSNQIIYFMGDDLVLLSSSPISLILRPTDKEVCARLAEFIKEIGQKS